MRKERKPVTVEYLGKLKVTFFFLALVFFGWLIWFSSKEQEKNCDYDMEILTMDCLLKQHREELRQLELERLEKLNGR